MSGPSIVTAHWDIRHGNRWTYEQFGCRCGKCQAAYDAHRARQLERDRRKGNRRLPNGA